MSQSKIFFRKAIQRAISYDRIASYQSSSDDDELVNMAHYCMNIAICESLYPALNVFEITLRNTVHGCIYAFSGNEFWMLDAGRLKGTELAKAEEARQFVLDQGKTLTSGRLVAELNFGFWTSLFTGAYDQQTIPLMSSLFPHAKSNERSLRTMRSTLHGIRKLRNRVYHYEPVLTWNCTQMHLSMTSMIAWMCPQMAQTLSTIDRFPQVAPLDVQYYIVKLKGLFA